MPFDGCRGCSRQHEITPSLLPTGPQGLSMFGGRRFSTMQYRYAILCNWQSRYVLNSNTVLYLESTIFCCYICAPFCCRQSRVVILILTTPIYQVTTKFTSAPSMVLPPHQKTTAVVFRRRRATNRRKIPKSSAAVTVAPRNGTFWAILIRVMS